MRFALFLLLAISAAAGDWPQWRGPDRSNVAERGASPVTEWSEDQNVRWKVELPGQGHSTPIIVGRQVFLTTSDPTKGSQSLLAIDRERGDIQWAKRLNQGALPEKIHPQNTHASPSPAWDGERVLTLFLNAGQLQVTATNPAGEVQWSKYVGKFHSERGWGYGSSPALHGNLIIIASDFRPGGYLVALDTRTGEEKWRTTRRDEPGGDSSRRGENASWGTPVVAHVAGRDQLLLSGRLTLSSYDPDNGKFLWSTPHSPLCTCGTAAWTKDAVFVSGGYPTNQTIGVRADGSGKILWKNRERSYEQSMLVHDGYLYTVSDTGRAICWRASDGSEMWKERIGSGGVMASPVLADGMIFASMKNGALTIFKASGKSYQKIAVNKLGDDAYASPVIVDDEIFLRVGFRNEGERKEVLYCLGRSRNDP